LQDCSSSMNFFNIIISHLSTKKQPLFLPQNLASLYHQIFQIKKKKKKAKNFGC
uniref:Ovule protein n=1 Tax=Brugia timori TaxID=42155 RepID=A0A0R3Q594_9BILA